MAFIVVKYVATNWARNGCNESTNKTAGLVYVTTIDAGLAALINWMASVGSSFSLNYGEDTRAWKCSWIVGGIRHVGNSLQMIDAVRECLKSDRLVLIPGDSFIRYLDIYRRP